MGVICVLNGSDADAQKTVTASHKFRNIHSKSILYRHANHHGAQQPYPLTEKHQCINHSGAYYMSGIVLMAEDRKGRKKSK